MNHPHHSDRNPDPAGEGTDDRRSQDKTEMLEATQPKSETLATLQHNLNLYFSKIEGGPNAPSHPTLKLWSSQGMLTRHPDGGGWCTHSAIKLVQERWMRKQHKSASPIRVRTALPNPPDASQHASAEHADRFEPILASMTSDLIRSAEEVRMAAHHLGHVATSLTEQMRSINANLERTNGLIEQLDVVRKVLMNKYDESDRRLQAQLTIYKDQSKSSELQDQIMQQMSKILIGQSQLRDQVMGMLNELSAGRG